MWAWVRRAAIGRELGFEPVGESSLVILDNGANMPDFKIKPCQLCFGEKEDQRKGKNVRKKDKKADRQERTNERKEKKAGERTDGTQKEKKFEKTNAKVVSVYHDWVDTENTLLLPRIHHSCQSAHPTPHQPKHPMKTLSVHKNEEFHPKTKPDKTVISFSHH